MRGRFITFEGGEGAGKSTQIALLRQRLEAAGRTVLATREPGGTPGAEEVRRLLVTGEPGRWDAWSEALLISAARRDHIERVIRPALASGTWVLCDRFLDSTLAYQGAVAGLGLDAVEALHTLVFGRLRPDLTVLLDLDPAVGLARAGKRANGEGRFEARGLEWHQRLREAFLAIAKAEPGRVKVIDASREQSVVADEVAQVVEKSRHG
ncbi:MAG TPA: dTMP kinase [Kiloniellales bacterium]|nr:dTMP kinase [Kiloniellales bacterium]